MITAVCATLICTMLMRRLLCQPVQLAVSHAWGMYMSTVFGYQQSLMVCMVGVAWQCRAAQAHTVTQNTHSTTTAYETGI